MIRVRDKGQFKIWQDKIPKSGGLGSGLVHRRQKAVHKTSECSKSTVLNVAGFGSVGWILYHLNPRKCAVPDAPNLRNLEQPLQH